MHCPDFREQELVLGFVLFTLSLDFVLVEFVFFHHGDLDLLVLYFLLQIQDYHLQSMLISGVFMDFRFCHGEFLKCSMHIRYESLKIFLSFQTTTIFIFHDILFLFNLFLQFFYNDHKFSNFKFLLFTSTALLVILHLKLVYLVLHIGYFLVLALDLLLQNPDFSIEADLQQLQFFEFESLGQFISFASTFHSSLFFKSILGFWALSICNRLLAFFILMYFRPPRASQQFPDIVYICHILFFLFAGRNIADRNLTLIIIMKFTVFLPAKSLLSEVRILSPLQILE